MRIQIFVAMLSMITVLASPTASFADTDPPKADPGCVRLGDPSTEDLWDMCPNGKSSCHRWNGYFGLGFWDSCADVGESPEAVCTWLSETSSWDCGGEKPIQCSESSCG